MKTSTFPIEYPFELKRSPHEQELERQVTLWIDNYTFLPESLRDRYKKSNFGRFATCQFPNAGFEDSFTMGKWVLAAFAFDDFYGSCSLEDLQFQCQKVIDHLEGKPLEPTDNQVFRDFSNSKDEFLPKVTSSWMKRFIDDHRFWFDGMETETIYSYNEKTTYPTLDEYFILREKVCGGRVMCDFIEIAADFILPDEVFAHPMVLRIRQLVSFMLAWFNDIHSVPWELERGEATNLVLVIKNEKGCTFEEAYEEAVKIHNNDLSEFIEISKNLPDFGTYNEGVRRYIYNAELYLKGQELWYFGGTERYTSANT